MSKIENEDSKIELCLFKRHRTIPSKKGYYGGCVTWRETKTIGFSVKNSFHFLRPEQPIDSAIITQLQNLKRSSEKRRAQDTNRSDPVSPDSTRIPPVSWPQEFSRFGHCTHDTEGIRVMTTGDSVTRQGCLSQPPRLADRTHRIADTTHLPRHHTSHARKMGPCEILQPIAENMAPLKSCPTRFPRFVCRIRVPSIMIFFVSIFLSLRQLHMESTPPRRSRQRRVASGDSVDQAQDVASDLSAQLNANARKHVQEFERLLSCSSFEAYLFDDGFPNSFVCPITSELMRCASPCAATDRSST